jgi:hypothetical protein
MINSEKRQGRAREGPAFFSAQAYKQLGTGGVYQGMECGTRSGLEFNGF